MAWITIGEAASALVTDVDDVRRLMASGVLSCVNGSDRRVMLDPDEVRALVLGESPAPAIPTFRTSHGETGRVSPSDHEPADAPDDAHDGGSLEAHGTPADPLDRELVGEGDEPIDLPVEVSSGEPGGAPAPVDVHDAPEADLDPELAEPEAHSEPNADPEADAEADPERSLEEILAGQGDVVERGRLAARVILALEDEIDALTALVRDAAVELTRRGATSPEIAEELGISSAAVVRLLTGLPVMGDDLPRPVALEGETITVPVAERWSSGGPGEIDDASVLVGVGGSEPAERPPAADDTAVADNWDLWRPADEFVPDDELDAASDSGTVPPDLTVSDQDVSDQDVSDQDVSDQSERDARVEAVAEMLADDALPTEAPPRRIESADGGPVAGDEGGGARGAGPAAGAGSDQASDDDDDDGDDDDDDDDVAGEPKVLIGSTSIDAALAQGCLGMLLNVLFPWRLLPLPDVLRRLFRR